MVEKMKITPEKDGTFNIRLVSVKNGGWVVMARDDDRGYSPDHVGAFTTTAEMISALTLALYGAVTEDAK